MKKPSITAGEWTHYNSKGGRIYQNWRVIDKRKVCVAKIEELPGGESEMANAQAIAALPKLIEALETLISESDITDHGDTYVEITRTTLEKARSALIAAGYTE